MSLQLSIDRFEGEYAVLATDDKRQINWPRDLLPDGCKPGDLLTIDLARDVAATRKLKRDTKRVMTDLEDRDPGGDIKL